jgi:hypothetical protein
MARIKQTLSERRHAAKEAAVILRERGNEEGALAIEQESGELDEIIDQK